MNIASRGLIVLALAFSVDAARAADGPAVKTFEAEGVIADVFDLFPRALKDKKQADQARAKATLKEVAARALVTKDGVYAFLETPENRRFLKDVKPGTAVAVKGRLLVSGALLHIDSLAKAKGDPGVDLARYHDEQGKEEILAGANKCQCGLSVAELAPFLHPGASAPPGGDRRQGLPLPPVRGRQVGVPGRRDPFQERRGEGAGVPRPVPSG